MLRNVIRAAAVPRGKSHHFYDTVGRYRTSRLHTTTEESDLGSETRALSVQVSTHSDTRTQVMHGAASVDYHSKAPQRPILDDDLSTYELPEEGLTSGVDMAVFRNNLNDLQAPLRPECRPSQQTL